MGVEINPAALGIAADNERSIGQVFLSYPDAAALETITDATTEVLTTRNQAYFPQLGQAPADVVVLDEPVIAPQPPPLPDRFGPIIQLGLALLAGLGLAFLVEYLDPTLRHRDEVESLGLRVISSVPR
jgi:capsular polysaccharide biosynthesis protein